jgi:predicted nuclease of predicted toxin-antitoxin system
VKLLLDQNLDHRLRTHLGSHEVFATSHKGWEELKNGKHLDAAEEEGFDVLITGDKTLSYEQNRIGRQLAIVALSAVEWRIIKDYLHRITAAVDSAAPGSFQVVDCGTFSRKKITRE